MRLINIQREKSEKVTAAAVRKGGKKNAQLFKSLESQSVLKLGMRADLTIYPALLSKSCNQRSVRRLRFLSFFLYPHTLCLHTLSDPNPRVSSGGRLPMCMMESALAELHCNIHRERQISSNSISGFRRGGSSKASLGYPAPSKWSNQIKGGKKRGGRQQHTQGEVIKTQSTTEARFSFSRQTRPA